MIHRVLWLKNLAAVNWHLKLTSVLLASLLWVALNGEPQSVVVFRVPIEYRNYPKGIEVIGDNINSIDVRVTASSGIVKRLDPTEITAFIDFSDWSLGERIYPLSSQNVIVPYGVKIIRITPNQVKLNFQRIRNKMVEVRPNITGDLQKGYRVEGVQARPNLVRISGPEGHLRSTAYLSTESIDISGKTGPFRAKVHLTLDDPLIQLLEDPEIEAEISIGPMIRRKK